MSENVYTAFYKALGKLTPNRFNKLRFAENLVRATGIFMCAIVICSLDNGSILATEQWAVDEVIAEAVGKIQRNYPGVPIEVSVPEVPLFVSMDPLLIEQVILNLSENSILHAKNVTTVWITVEKREDCAAFYIRDDGGGFPQEVLDEIQRGTIRTKISEDGEGKRNMGLGIRVCSAVIRAHGGKLSAQNGQGGALVYFTLPLGQD